MPLFELATARRLVTFGLVGAIGTAAHYVLLVFLVEAFGIDPVASTTVGFVAGAAVNYVLNRRFTFRSTKAHLNAGSRFFLIALLTGLLNGWLLHLGVKCLGLNYLMVQVLATVTVFLANFILNSIWTFRETAT